MLVQSEAGVDYIKQDGLPSKDEVDAVVTPTDSRALVIDGPIFIADLFDTGQLVDLDASIGLVDGN